MKKIYFAFFLFIGLQTSYAQTVVKGIVYGKQDNAPLPGATIVLDGSSSIGTTSDAEGRFSLQTTESSGTLIISFVGMKEQRVNFQGDRELTIYLEDDATSLSEVVVIGYGSSRKGDLTSSIASVDRVSTIASRPVKNLSDFLQGSVPGVTVLQQGGDPTANPSIVIRGNGSFSNEQPLYVVDGVPYYGPPINPNDIESISILKDASAAAIYGAQAASGVVVITTKKGVQGKTRITFDAYTGVQQAYNLPTPLNAKQQADVYNLAADNAGVARKAAHDPAQNPWGQVTRTNWMDAIFRSATTTNANLNISGANDKINYMTSFGYNQQEGILVGTDFQRYSLRLKADYQLLDNLSIGENLYFSRSEATGTNSSSSYSGSIINAMYMPSAAPVRDEDGNFHGTVPFELSSFAGAYGDVYNPVALLLRPTTNSPEYFINANIYANYEIVDGLSFRSSYAYSYTDWRSKRFSPRIPELGRTNLNNSLTESFSKTNRWVWDNQLSFEKSFGLHNLNVTAIYSAQFTDYEYYSQTGTGFSSEEPFNQYMSNASEFNTPVTDVYEDALTSAIARVMYNYDHRYYLSASIRRDETSRLARANQADYFPSVSAGWRISEESFFNVNWLNNLKVRGSWGQIGNINSVGYYSYNAPLGSTTVVLGDGATLDYKGVYASQQSNPNLKWETSESVDIGLDAGLLSNKLELTVDYFSKTTKNMILDGLEDHHQGTAAAKVNGGEVKNTGIEVATTYASQIGNVNFSASLNYSKINNELINLDGYNSTGIDYIAHSDNVRDNLRPYRSSVGQPLYATYLVPYLGIFQTQEEINAHQKDGQLIQPNAVPGDFKFQDTNNDGEITDEDRVFMDSYLPDFTYGLTLTASYKNFDLSLIFQGVGGVKVFNGAKYTTLNASQSGYNLDSRVLNAWSEGNRDSNIPRVSTQDNNQNFGTASSWYLEDAAYLRLKNLTIGYTMPTSLMQKISSTASLRFFGSAENLFTITDYSGFDPEVGGIGLDVARYPVAQKFVAGLSLSF